MHDIGALAGLAAEALAEQLGDIGLVIDDNETGAPLQATGRLVLAFKPAVGSLAQENGKRPFLRTP